MPTMEEFNCSYIRFKALSQIISLLAVTPALGFTAALGLRPCRVGEHQLSCHTTFLWWNLPSSHTKTLSSYKLCQRPFAGAHGNKKSALSGRGFHCLTSGSKTLERPVELTCNHMKSHLALIWIDKSRKVLLEIEFIFVQKVCKSQPRQLPSTGSTFCRTSGFLVNPFRALVSHSYYSCPSPLWSYMPWCNKTEILRHSHPLLKAANFNNTLCLYLSPLRKFYETNCLISFKEGVKK